MRRASFSIASFVALAALVMQGCTDLGDSSAIPSAVSEGSAGGEDATTSGAPPLDDGGGALSEDGAASSDDAASGTGPSSDDGAVSAGGEDAGLTDALADDGGAFDASLDATILDAEASDDASGEPDTGAGAVFDAGNDSAPAVDAGRGAGPDAGVDAGGNETALAPCTTVGQTNCVLCQFNNGAAGTQPNASQLCTPTEAALVAHDIATGQVSAPGPDADQSCYACAAQQGCLDDSEFNDKGHECEDLSGSSTQAECESTLACILGSACGFASGALSTCYCGTAAVSGACAAVGASNGANGACKTTEAAGLGFSATDGLDILKNFTSTTLPSGIANNILQCAASNSCTACLH